MAIQYDSVGAYFFLRGKNGLEYVLTANKTQTMFGGDRATSILEVDPVQTLRRCLVEQFQIDSTSNHLPVLGLVRRSSTTITVVDGKYVYGFYLDYEDDSSLIELLLLSTTRVLFGCRQPINFDFQMVGRVPRTPLLVYTRLKKKLSVKIPSDGDRH